jgi:hypothetical protein
MKGMSGFFNFLARIRVCMSVRFDKGWHKGARRGKQLDRTQDFGSSSIGAGKGRPSLRIASLDPLISLTCRKGTARGLEVGMGMHNVTSSRPSERDDE